MKNILYAIAVLLLLSSWSKENNIATNQNDDSEILLQNEPYEKYEQDEEEYIYQSNEDEYNENKDTYTNTTPIGKYRITTQALNIREKASKSANIIGKLYENQEVEIYGIERNWAMVNIEGRKGYISTKYIEVVEYKQSKDFMTHLGEIVEKIVSFIMVLFFVVGYFYIRKVIGTNNTSNNTLKEKKNQKKISNIILINGGKWYDIYDEKGNRFKTIARSNIGDILDFSSNFFIARDNSRKWYYIYDVECKRIKALPCSIGNIISVSGDTFVVKRGNWLDTYDKIGNRISTKSAI